MGSIVSRGARLAQGSGRGDGLPRASGGDRQQDETEPNEDSGVGGAWWDVAVPEVSERAEVNAARESYEAQLRRSS